MILGVNSTVEKKSIVHAVWRSVGSEKLVQKVVLLTRPLALKGRFRRNSKEKYILKEVKPDSTENVLLLKNPQLLSNYHETL